MQRTKTVDLRLAESNVFLLNATMTDTNLRTNLQDKIICVSTIKVGNLKGILQVYRFQGKFQSIFLAEATVTLLKNKKITILALTPTLNLTLTLTLTLISTQTQNLTQTITIIQK